MILIYFFYLKKITLFVLVSIHFLKIFRPSSRWTKLYDLYFQEMIFYLLLVLPALVAGDVNLKINYATSESKLYAQSGGIAEWPTTKTDRQAFGLSDDVLYAAADMCFCRTTAAYLNVRVEVNVASTPIILSYEKETVNIDLKEFLNKDSTSRLFSGAMTASVEDLISSTWSSDVILGDDEPISMIVDSHVNLHLPFGKQTHRSIPKTISAEDRTILEPDQGMRGTLKAVKHSAKIQFNYEVTLDGSICWIYRCLLIFKKAHCSNVEDVLNDQHLPKTIKSSQIINVTYYSDAFVSSEVFTQTPKFSYRSG